MIGSTHRAGRGGYRVTWEADLRTGPDGDAVHYLRDGLRELRGHPEVASATCRYRRREARIEFDVQVAHALTPDFAMVRTEIALRESLQRAGLGHSRRRSARSVPLSLRLDRGPASIQRA